MPTYNTNVVIEIFSEKGEIIETIINRKYEAGTFEIEFNAVNLPEGVYTCLMTAGEFTSVKRMLLQKDPY